MVNSALIRMCLKRGNRNLSFLRNFSAGTSNVNFESFGEIGRITLHREEALNALNASMGNDIRIKLLEWNTKKKLIIIKGHGDKAFCAGGDAVSLVKSIIAGKTLYKEIFRTGYDMIRSLGNLSIPVLSVIDGITMGLGVGLCIHGKYRLATERTLLAMPEVRIGFFPDGGTPHFYSRLKNGLGEFLLLTGHRLKGHDILRAGIATHMCNSGDLPNLEKDLLSLNSISTADIENVLLKYQENCEAATHPFSLEADMNKINKIFGKDNNFESTLKQLESDDSEWATKIKKLFREVSPTSLKVTARLLELERNTTFNEVIKLEYRAALRFCESHDFIEGIRKHLLDKGKENPIWNPNSLEEVNNELIEKYLAPFSNPTKEL